MPIYEYVCADCERRFEKYVSTWGQAVRCPDCESGDVQKQLSSFAFSVAGGSSSPGASGCGCGRGSCGCHH
jgi:putative FmdB family regulatory protein